MLAHGHSKESGMPEGDSAVVERVIANSINETETARGDPDALAARIVAALAEAGYRIVAASGIEDTALGPSLPKRDSSTGAPTAIAGSLPTIPPRARPLSGTRRTPRQAVK